MFRKVHAAKLDNVKIPRLIDTAGFGVSEENRQKIIPVIFGKQRYFACLCVVGCKDCISEFDYRERPIARVDRNMIICDPVIYIDMEDIEQFYKDMRQTHFEFLLSLGIKNSEEMQKLMKELKL